MSALQTIRGAQGPFIASGCRFIWRLAAVNVVGLALVLLGGGPFGLAPAMAAMLRAHAEPAEVEVGTLVPMMWREWRSEYVRANLVALPFLAIGTAGIVASWQAENAALATAVTGMTTLAFVMAGSAIVAIARHAASPIDTLANALLIVRHAPARLLVLTLAWPIVAAASFAFPPFGLWFALSAHALLAVRLLDPVLTPFEPTESAA